MSRAEQVRHPVFARIYERISVKGEAKGEAALRDEMLEGASGRVIEVGAGNGLNFGHYPVTVSEVVAVEPEPYLRLRSEAAARSAPIPVRVVDGVASSLPAEDGAFDVGVASLVLCSVADQPRALGELWRVIRPGGELRFFEHIRSGKPGFARFQQAVDVVWPRVAGGCHTDRDTVRAIEAAGFVVERARYFSFRAGVMELPVAPKVIGLARRP